MNLAIFLLFLSSFIHAQDKPFRVNPASSLQKAGSNEITPLSLQNSYNVSEKLWRKYLDKTNSLLEKVNPESFLNYVVFSSTEGNMADMPFFKKFIEGNWKKDKEELVYKVGTGAIKDVKTVKLFLSSLQPAYADYYVDFVKRKDVIIESQNYQNRAPINNDPVPFNCGSPCTNPGFESGNTFWDYWAGDADTTANPSNLVSGFNPANSSQHIIETVGGYDPLIGGTTLPMVASGSGSKSLRIGDGKLVVNSPSTGIYSASRASISFTVSAANTNFTYRYAVVLEEPVPPDPPHNLLQRPYFRVKVRDASGNVLPCADYAVIADPAQPNFSTDFIQGPSLTDAVDGSTGIAWYKPWTTVFVPLQAYIGQCVSIEFTVSDCSKGGHFGYAYIDGNCDPLIITASATAICAATPVTLTAPAGAAAYAWTNTYGGTTGIVGSSSGQTCVVDSAGTYQVVLTSVSGPSCTTTLTITVGSSPNNPVPYFTNTTVCAGTPTQFTDASTPSGSVSSWAWDFNNDGIVDDTGQNPSYTFSAAGTYPVSLTVSWGSCSSTIIQNVIDTIGAIPILAPAGPFCSNDSPITLTANIGPGTWSGPGITDASNGVFDPSVAMGGNNAITYTPSVPCSGIANMAIIVNPLPISDAGPDITTCTGIPGNLGTTSTSGYDYSWVASAGLSSSTISNPTVTLTTNDTIPLTFTYTVLTTNTSSGCSSTDQVNVTVTSGMLPAITPAGPFCSNAAPIILTANLSGGTWSGTGITNAVTGMFDPSVAASGGNTITYTATGSCTGSTTTTILVNPLPVSDAGPDIAICTGNAGNLGVPSTAGYNYSWTPTTGLNSPNVSNPTVTLTNGGSVPITSTYTIITTDALSGCFSSDQVEVTVNPLPTANAGSSQSVCPGSSITLNGALGGLTTSALWTGGNGTYSPNNTDLLAVYTPSAAEYAAGSVTLTLTSTGLCPVSSSNVTFYFYQNPVIFFTVDAPDGCPGHCVSFTDNSTIGGGDSIVSWHWDFGDNTTSNQQNPSHCYLLTGFYNVTLTAVSNHGCAGFHTVIQMVHIYPLPVAEFDPTPNPATLLDPNVTMVNQSSQDVNYWNWNFGDGATLTGLTSSPTHPYANESPGSYVVTLIVSNTHGCLDTVVHEISIIPEFTFFIPNAFTPNGDGVNEYFYGTGVGIIEYDLWIFDRWGAMIFHSDDLDKKWNGKANNGAEIAQQDVYVWKVKLTDVFNKKHNYIGTVTLVK